MKKIIALLLLMLALSASAACAENNQLYDRVMRSGKLRAAYASYPPLLIKDPNKKKFSGIGYDILELACKRLGLKLEMTEEVHWGVMIEGLKTNRYDIMACPIWANATRAKAVDFSRPLCYSTIYAYTKYGDKRIESSLKNLNSPKFKVASIDAEMGDIITKSDFPQMKRLSLPQMADISDLLMSVSTGKADVTFIEPVFAHNFVKHNPNSVQNITPNKPVRIFPNTFMFNTGEEKFKAMLNLTLDEMLNNGDIDKILNKYEPFPKAYLRVAKPYQ